MVLHFCYWHVIIFFSVCVCRYVSSWIETRENASEKSNLVSLFDKYIPSCLENVRTRFKKITPIAEMAHIQMLCHLLSCLLTPTNTPADCPKEWHDLYFCFACVWAFGAAMFQDQVNVSHSWYITYTHTVLQSHNLPLFSCNGL